VSDELHSIKKNGCELTIFVEDGKVYPRAFGKVPDKLNKGINELTGVQMKPEMALALLKNNF
jgi:hypothetical protein